MSYILVWKNPAVDPGKSPITVPVGSTVSNATSLTFTGKGAANYGKVQQENLMRLLENFADATAPNFPTVGQLWFDTSISTLKVFSDSAPATWKSLGGVQVRNSVEGPPANPQIGDLWFERTGPSSGYLYVYNNIGRFPYSLTVNGGWSQIWPRVDAAGLRQEYDQVNIQVDSLCTSLAFVSMLFSQLPQLSALDADLSARIAGPNADAEINSSGVAFGPIVQPVSYDWDALLSLARWLVSRLDIPLNSWDDISSFPFVQDGRQVRSYLLNSYHANDPRATPLARRTSRPLGSITLHRLYAETINILSAAMPFRYSLRGIAGASGTNASFAPDVVTYRHARRAGNWTGGSLVSASTQFNWNNATERDRFIAGGSALEITARLIGGSGATNASLNSFLNGVGRIRVTGDRIRWFDASAVPVMTTPSTASGLLNITAVPGLVTLDSQSGSGNGILVSGQRTSNGLILTVSVNAPAGVNGTLQVDFDVIHDRTTYDVTELELYPAPLSYNSSTDSAGTSAVLAHVILPSPPVVNFTANGNTGPGQITATTGVPVNFVFTGFGAPTLIEWDFIGDGNFTATGPTASFTYGAAGIYSPRCRASNANGQDVLFRPGMIRV